MSICRFLYKIFRFVSLSFFSRVDLVSTERMCATLFHTLLLLLVFFSAARAHKRNTLLCSFRFSFFFIFYFGCFSFCFSFFLLLLLLLVLLPPMLACCTEAMWIFVTEHHHYRTDTEVYTDRCQLQDEVDPLHRRTRADRLSRVR